MRPIAYIAAATRSGSTHIKNCLVKLGWTPVGIHLTLEDHHNEEHMVDPRIAATLFPQGGFVIQQHSRAIGRNAFLLGEYEIRPIVTYRNILDSIVSFVDSTNQDAGDSSKSHLPIHIRNWKWMTYDEKSWWTAYNMTPWWLSFYSSWRDSGLDCLFVSYERFFKDQVRGLNEIVHHLGMNVLLEESLIRAVDNKDSRFNVGKVGRGDRLPKELKKMVRHQASLYGLREGTVRQNCLMLGAGKSPVKRKLVAPTSLPEDHTDWTTLDYYVEADIKFNLWKVAEGEQIPVDSESFDEVAAYEVLEHFGQQGNPQHFFNTFNEIWRVLKPGGLLIGTTPGQSPVWGWGDPGHTRIISPESFIWLEKKNYENVGTGNPMSDYSSLIAPFWWEKQHSEYASPHTFCFWLKKVV